MNSFLCTNPMYDRQGTCLQVIKRIGDWYLMEHGTYIKIYRATKAPHLLPRFVPDKLVLQEVAYQTMINGVGEMLYRDKKEIWPPLPLWIGSYSFTNTKQAQDEVDVLLCITSEKRDSEGMTQRKLSKNTLIILASHGNTLWPHGRKRKSIVVPGHMMRSFQETRKAPRKNCG
jgi:hypothetical protein